MQLAPTDCLLIIDVQNDFLPGGALAVPDSPIKARVLPVACAAEQMDVCVFLVHVLCNTTARA